MTSQPAGVSCRPACQKAFAGGSTVTLTATPGSGYFLYSWGDACTGNAKACAVTMDSNKSVQATFQSKANAYERLNPTSGPPGQLVQVAGGGFALEQVTVTLDGVPVAQTGTYQGRFAVTIHIPTSESLGPHTIAAHGTNSGNTASATFTVT